MNTGKAIIISAPSGAGKTTIVHRLLDMDLDLQFSVSATSRKQRGEEENGKDYLFLSPEEFKEKINAEEFVEWEEVYPDQFYGTLKSEIERIWKDGKHVIFDVDVIGGMNIKKSLGVRALSIFIMPPSVDELERRLRSRKTETEEKINMRVAKAKSELEFAEKFDITIVNDVLEDAVEEASASIANFLKIQPAS